MNQNVGSYPLENCIFKLWEDKNLIYSISLEYKNIKTDFKLKFLLTDEDGMFTCLFSYDKTNGNIIFKENNGQVIFSGKLTKLEVGKTIEFYIDFAFEYNLKIDYKLSDNGWVVKKTLGKNIIDILSIYREELEDIIEHIFYVIE